jgi:FG-GAP-like repeat/Bacterial Ig-like domain (group 3)
MTHSSIVALRRRMIPRQASLRLFRPMLLSALALLTAMPAAWAISPTTTSLFITPDAPASGAVITMTAQVSSDEFTVAGGSVTFVDTYNGVSEVVGTVQVQSTNGNPGLAVLETEVGGVGVHQFVANFTGTVPFSASSSTTQSVNFIPTYLSATALASSGTTGNYTLTATVSAFGPTAPTGSVTFTDTTSNLTLGTAALNAASLRTGFTSAQNYPIANMNNGNTGNTIGPAIGDFNGDGHLDYAVPTNGGPIAILLGNGNGTFTNGTSIQTVSPFEPTSVVVGDFNGDGKQDLAVLSAAGTGSVNTYLGNGDGTFQAARNYPVATSTSNSRLLAIGDFNRDGIQDLAATNITGSTVAIILGNGDGSFNAPAFYGVGPGAWNVVVGDINKDGLLDLAVASDGGGNVSVLLGNGDGTFKPVSFVAVGSSQVGSVALGDFNGDGYLDLATTSAPDNSVYILLNKGTSTVSFGAPAQIVMNGGPTTNSSPYYLTIGDFNRDGKTDIISANNTNSTVALLLGNGTGGFATPTYYPVPAEPIFATEADINGDDQVDLTAVTDNGLSVLLSGQSETASLSNVAFHGCSPQSAVATYGGDASYSPSTSAASSFNSTKQTTALALTVTPAANVAGQQVLLQAMLSPSAYGTTTTNGEVVTFTNNGAFLGTAVLASGVATLNVTLAVGTDMFQATYVGDCGFSGSTSGIVPGSTLRASTLTWNTPAAITYGTPLSATQLDATDNHRGTFVYSPSAGTILPAGTSTLTVTFTPNNPLFGVETASVQLVVNRGTTELIWPTPTPITYGTPLSGFQLDATASSGVVAVPLASYFNVSGIYTPGSKYGSGGFDNDGYSYSTTKLGSTLNWNGMTFNIGPANAQDAVSNLTINLPAGKFSTLYMLGAMVNNIGATQTFVVKYTDNTTTTFTQNMSDWFNAAGWPGESVIDCQEDRNFDDGTTQADSVCIYGYQMALDPTKSVKTVTLPNTRNIVMLAMNLATPSIPGTYVYTPPAGTIEPVGTDTLAVTFTPTDTTDYTSASATVQLVVEPPVTPIVTTTIAWPTPANITFGTALSAVQLDAVAMGTARPTPVIPTSQLQVLSTSTDGTSFNQPGFDNAGHTYSYNQLGNGTVNYAGTAFSLGAPTVPNALSNGAVYTLTAPGNYSTVYLIGAAITTGQINEPFTLNYADTNGPVTDLVSMSSWAAPAGYTGESVVAATTHENTQGGGSVAGTFDLYGYQIPVDPTRTLVSVTLPSTRNVVIMALGFGTNTQVVVPGTYVYTPPSGTVLPVGTWPLSVAFTPTNTNGYTAATDSVNIIVTKATPIITWPTPAAVPVGTVLGGTQLDATASVPGTFTYTPAAGTVLNTAGTVTLNVIFVPTDTTDYTNQTASVQLVVGDIGSFGISGAAVFPAGDCCFFNQPTPYTITVTGSTAVPTGTVQVIFKSQVIGTATLAPVSGATSAATLQVTSSFFRPGSNNVTLSYLGDSNYIPNTSPTTIALRNPAIGVNTPPAVGQSVTTLVPYTFVADGTINFNFNPQGAPDTDFTDGGTGTCKSGTPALAGSVCLISIAFKPRLPGARKGAVEIDFVPASGGATEPTLYLFPYGMGDAAQIALSSATQSVLNSTLSEPQSVVFDPTDASNSKLYVANSNLGQIDTLPSTGGPLTRWNAAHTGSLVYPSDLVFDAFDDLVVSDATAAKVFLYTPAQVQNAVSTGTFVLGLPTAIKADLGGNLYIADAGATPRIIQVPGEAYAPNLVNLGSQSVSFPQALAVDNTGSNLYVGDGNLNQILDIGLDGTGNTTTVSQFAIAPCDSTVAICALNSPGGFAFDPNGDMFITDSGARVLMVPGAQASLSTPTTLVPMTGLVNPSGITLDGSGNIYVSDLGGTVTKLWVNAGALSFVGQPVGSTLTTTVTNTGNLSLKITALTFTSGVNFTETDTCKGKTIAGGGSCTITVTSNATGSASDTLTLTSNAFSTAGVTIKVSH